MVAENKPVSEMEVAAVEQILKYADIKHGNQSGLHYLRTTLTSLGQRIGVKSSEADINEAIDRGIRFALGSYGFEKLTAEQGSVDVAHTIADILLANASRYLSSEADKNPSR